MNLFKSFRMSLPKKTNFFLVIIVSFCTSVFLVASFEDDLQRIYISSRKTLFQSRSNDHNNHLTSGGIFLFNPWILASSAYIDSLKVLSSQDNSVLRNSCQRVVNVSDKLLLNSKYNQDIHSLLLPYNIHFSYGLKPGFFSSMAQARASVVVYAASKCVKEKQIYYLESSKLLLKPVFTPITRGGALLIDDQKVWYQEYAQGTRILPTVLNGHLYTAEALSHIIESFPGYYSIHRKSLSSTCQNIHNFDLGFWSLYDLNHDSKDQSTIANTKYHKTHIRQLRDYAYIFPCPAKFNKLSSTLSSQLNSPSSRIRWFYLSGIRTRVNVAFILLFATFFIVLSFSFSFVLKSLSDLRR